VLAALTDCNTTNPKCSTRRKVNHGAAVATCSLALLGGWVLTMSADRPTQ
jgi:hypothetical protein